MLLQHSQYLGGIFKAALEKTSIYYIMGGIKGIRARQRNRVTELGAKRHVMFLFLDLFGFSRYCWELSMY